MNDIIPGTPLKDIIYKALASGSNIQIDSPEHLCFSQFGSISDVQEFVARAAARYDRQGLVVDKGTSVWIHITGAAELPNQPGQRKEGPLSLGS